MGQEPTTRAIPDRDPAGLRRQRETVRGRPARSEQAEDELGHLFAHSLDLLCVAGFDGYFKRLNPAWTTCLGWSQEELKARPFLDFVHPDDREATLAEVGTLAEGAETILFENRYRCRDGSYRWLQWNARAVPGGQQIYAVARDVTRQKWLEREVIEIRDQERERLGRELHDGLCQSLTGIAALSSTLSRRLAAISDSAASASAAEIAKLLSDAIGQARDLARGLAPVGLNEVGLDGALEVLAVDVQHQFQVICTLARDRPFPKLHQEVEVHLYRIAQEAVNNAVVHGNADRLEIGLSCKDGQGLLSVRDDGVGLPDETPDPRGLGLHTMAYRAHLIGGSLEVRGRTPRGTAVSCVFPLTKPPENPGHARNDT